jgi:hypothetical protein
VTGWLRLSAWLEDKSDWLSPLVVKEVRQVVRGREFLISFAASLVVGLVVAFFGAAQALAGQTGTGRWTFASLTACLAFLGLAIVPLGAYGALRNERLEQTLELITLTALSPRRIVIGKLFAQGIKLSTLFAAMAPFVTMSFLLGGIDLATILLSLAALFLASLWIGALCLFLSATFKSRAMSGLIFGAVGLVMLFFLIAGSNVLVLLTRGIPAALVGASYAPWAPLWVGAQVATFWLVTLVNLVLLAENRLALTTEDSVTPLRLGFFVQFLAIVAWTMAYLAEPAITRGNAADALAGAGCVHLAIVAAFAVTEGFAVPRRVLHRMTSPSRWRWLLASFGPGGGRGAAFVLAQMVMLAAALSVFRPGAADLRWLLGACGYILCFTGVPVLLFTRLAPSSATPLRLRVTVLLTLAAATVVPDVLYYVIVRPELLDLEFAPRHLINPFRTLANWELVEARHWLAAPFLLGGFGLLAYGALMRLGSRENRAGTTDVASGLPPTGQPDRGDAVY